MQLIPVYEVNAGSRMTPWSMRRRFSMYTPEVYTWNDLTHDGLRTSDFKTEDVKEDIDRGYFVRVTKCNC